MRKTFLKILIIILFLGGVSDAFGQEIEDESEPRWGIIIGLVAGAIITSVIAPLIKKRHTNKLMTKKELFKRPSFFVQKIRWTGTNLTYAVLFDKERILFVHAHKISKAPKDSTVEDILKMSKHNFQIPLEEITLMNLVENKDGVNGARAGVFYVDTREFNGEFDVMVGQELKECQKIIDEFWTPNEPTKK